MLTDPPCVDELMGCADTFFGGDSAATDGGSTSASSSSRGASFFRSASHGASSSSSRSSYSFSSRSSSSRSNLSDLSRYLGSGSSFLRGRKEYIGRYSLKVQNIGTTPLQGVKVVHGPLPYNLTFDPTKSSSECYQNQKNIECMTDIEVGYTKDLSIIYKATSSFSCTSARFLQTAKATTSTAADSTQAIVSVSCDAETLDTQSSSSSSYSSSASSISSSLPTYITNSASGSIASSAPVYVTYGSGNLVTQTFVPAPDSKIEGSKGGYKPYTYVMPKTGVGDYFSAVTSSDYVLIPKGAVDASGFSLPLLILSFLSAIALLKIGTLAFSR